MYICVYVYMHLCICLCVYIYICKFVIFYAIYTHTCILGTLSNKLMGALRVAKVQEVVGILLLLFCGIVHGELLT